MRNVLMALAGGIVVGGLVVWGISRHAETPTAAPDDARALAAGSEPQTLQLSTEQQAKAGIVVASLETRELPREVKGYGQVVDPQPLLDLLTELKSADASREASAKEYARVQALHANDQNASARAVEAAAAAMKRDQIQVEAARNKLTHAWGASLVTRTDLPKVAQALTTLDAVMIRVDLPLDEPVPAPAASARVLSPSDPKQSARAQPLGPARLANAQAPSQGFMFLLQPNSLELRTDMGVVAFLEIRGAPMRVRILPRSALIRLEGQTWIYAQTGDATFVRRPVVLDQATDEGWLIPADVDLPDRVVVAGAQALLSEELKSQIRLAD